MIAPWFVRQPLLLRKEQNELTRDYPEMQLVEPAFAAGRLTFEGVLPVALGPETRLVTLSLEYPSGFPYLRPEVIPLREPAAGDSAKREPRFFSARHQMATGSICLFERDPADDPHAYVSGITALRRARTWLPHAMRGALPSELDTLESELEAHYTFDELGA